MSSDRAYMRSDYQRRSTSTVVWLVSIIIAAFVLQLVLLAPWFGSGAILVNYLALTIPGMKDWHLWTLATHSLLHNTDWPWHILFTLVGLIFVGRELEPLLGPRKFVALYIGSIIVSALCWCAVHSIHGGGIHIGAGAAIFAFLVVLSEISPGMEFNVFYFPVSFRLRFLVWVFLAVESIGLLFYEIPGARVPLWLSPSTHLGGMLAGWLYFRFLHARDGLDRAAGFPLPKWLRFGQGKSKSPTPSYGQRRPAAHLRSDVDRILDKINSHGFGSLSDEEKRTLDEAKDMLSKR